MCGIAYKHNFDGYPVNNDILNIFDKQRRRGTDGFGLFDGKGMHVVHAAKEDRILRWIAKRKNDSHLIMFHHRYPTSTVNTKRTAHPFSTKEYFGKTQYILVHNGGVHNAEELKAEHEKRRKKISYHSVIDADTFNDSEAFLWDFALYMEGKQKKLKARGPCAFMCVKLVNGELRNLYFGRNWERPLRMEKTNLGLEVSSEGPGEIVGVDTLYTWVYKQKRLYERYLEVPEPIRPASTYTGKGYYDGSYAASPPDDDYVPQYEWNAEKGKWEEKPRAGDWVSDAIRAKFSKVYDFDKGEEKQTTLKLPANTVMLTKEERRLQYLQPSTAEVEEKVLQYLLGCNGHFEQAYWAMELDYEKLCENDGNSDKEVAARLLLELALNWLQNDPEYVDEQSVSSLWESIWVK